MSSRLEETASITGQRYRVLAAVMLGGIMDPIDASIGRTNSLFSGAANRRSSRAPQRTGGGLFPRRPEICLPF